MTTADPEAFFSRWLAAINALDFDAVETMVAPDFVMDWPQSGERLVGFGAFRAEMASRPGGAFPDSTDVTVSRLLQDPERWALSPGFTVVPMSAPDQYTTVVRVTYPDGTRWWIVTLIDMKGDRVHHLECYFAPEMAAPLAESIGRAEPG